MGLVGDARTAVEASVALVKVRSALRTRTRDEVIGGLAERSVVESAQGVPDVDAARRLGQLVNGVANRLWFDLNCLPRTLVTWYLLRKRGITADMRVGVRVGDAGHRIFHTWVELQGIPLNDRRDVAERYRVLQTPSIDDGSWE